MLDAAPTVVIAGSLFDWEGDAGTFASKCCCGTAALGANGGEGVAEVETVAPNEVEAAEAVKDASSVFNGTARACVAESSACTCVRLELDFRRSVHSAITDISFCSVRPDSGDTGPLLDSLDDGRGPSTSKKGPGARPLPLEELNLDQI